jgi:hypothetical protein
VVGKLNSQFEGHGFEYHPILYGNGVKAMPGLISAPNPGSFNDCKEKNTGIQMGHKSTLTVQKRFKQIF